MAKLTITHAVNGQLLIQPPASARIHLPTVILSGMIATWQSLVRQTQRASTVVYTSAQMQRLAIAILGAVAVRLISVI